MSTVPAAVTSFYSDAQEAIELLKCLGFPKVLYIGSFRRSPSINFRLICEILHFLRTRVNGGIVNFSAIDLSTPDRRYIYIQVITPSHYFFCTIALCMFFQEASKWVLQGFPWLILNWKAMYAADDASIGILLQLLKEIVFVTNLEPQKTFLLSGLSEHIDHLDTYLLQESDMLKSNVLSTLETGCLVSKILNLEKSQNIVEREKALDFVRSFDQQHSVSQQENFLSSWIESMLLLKTSKLQQLEAELRDCHRKERILTDQAKQKETEIERGQQRLSTLNSMKPKLASELEDHEYFMRISWAEYVKKHQNLEFLESQLDRHLAEEKTKTARHHRELKRLQQRLFEEEWNILQAADI
eukprot:Filipodium_phascolosomae@DN468_c0_g1_i1.p1